MEPISKFPDSVKGLEILYFPEAEIEKFQGTTPIFSASGPLSVLYFPTYNRYFLKLNNWTYPLLRRLPILISSIGEGSNRTYILPGGHGSMFNLNVTWENLHGLTNFETILANNANFSYKSEDISNRKTEASPDDKLSRKIQENIEQKEPGSLAKALKPMTGPGFLKTVTNKVISTVASLKPKSTLAKKKRYNLNDLKTKDFKKTAKSTFKKNFFKNSENNLKQLDEKRKGNLNMTQNKPFKDLKKGDYTFFFNKNEIEDMILNYKDIAMKVGFDFTASNLEKSTFKSGGTQDIPKETSVSNSRVGQGPMEAHDRGRKPNVQNFETQNMREVGFDTYQG